MMPPEGQPSWRKPAGMALILLMIALWVGLVASFSGPLARLPGLAQLGVYLAAGIGWIWLFPFRRLFIWMETGRWG